MGGTLSSPGMNSQSFQSRLDKALDSRGRRRPADEMFTIRFKEPFGDFDLLRNTSCQGVAHPVHIVMETRSSASQNKPPRFLDRICYPESDHLTIQECLEMQNRQEPKHLARLIGKNSTSSRTTIYYEHNNLGSVASQLRRCRPPGGRAVAIPTAMAIRLIRQTLLAIQAIHPANNRMDAFEHGHISLESILCHVDKNGTVDFTLSGFDRARQFQGDARLEARLAAAAADKSRLVLVVQDLIALSHRDPRHLPDLQVLKAIETDLTALLTLRADLDVARDMRWLTDKLLDLENRHVRSARQRQDMDLFEGACRDFARRQAVAGGDLFWKSRGELDAWAAANLNPLDSWVVVWWSKESVDPLNGVEIPRR